MFGRQPMEFLPHADGWKLACFALVNYEGRAEGQDGLEGLVVVAQVFRPASSR